MKREKGFTLVEMLVSVTLMLLVIAATMGALTSAVNATQGITLMADTQQNLRAGLNYMVRDFLQAGEGMSQVGITIPNTAGVSAVGRPGLTAADFPASWTALPAVTPGYQLGPITSTSGAASDIVTLIYADTTLLDTNGHWLNEYPVYLAPKVATGCAAANPNPAPAGSIVTAGSTTTVTFDLSCINISTGNTGLNPGDLILLQNNNTIGYGSITATDTDISDSSGSTALLTVSSVNPAANSITFSAGDAFNLNASGATAGTIKQIQTPPGSGTYPTTTVTRFWMVTYYINNANPARPMLMRQVNMNPPQAVGEVIENMQIFYDILNAGATPPALLAQASGSTQWENPASASLPDIRDAYIILYARSDNVYTQTNTYFRNNLETVVSMRGLDFYNQFQ